ncbi:Mu-like prophage FluMu protein gp29 [Fulvivirga imtechensis AK7]|uniref:Mu-like prophage FluMu protein gp29 n=1 Tax=Fulvivirga imtechensis AK7 TaxID=1237149 RepID=L8JNT2_9BACT|nr:DUF935 family protein [Fulvivirga imtechensis]ELR69174.1 Mu-like prophage FluMu protein gp29 [Fulvivirga imtechensis AK7]
MAKKEKKQKAQTDPEIVINQINVGQLQRGNQDIQKWISNVKSAERVQNPYRKPLLDTYHDLSIDLHLDMVISKRVRAVKTCPFEWEDLEVDVIRENFRSPWFFEYMENIMDFVFQGHNVIEHVFENGLIVDTEIIPRQNIYPKEGIITKEMWGSKEKGWNYREEPYKYYMLEIGKPKDLGLYAKIAPYVLLKRGNLADYSRFNEMFGMPLRWYEYDPHDPGAREEVTKQAKAQGAAAYVVVPKGTSVNFHEANQSGASTTYKDLHQILNDEITIGVLGQKLTTSSEGKGSYALGSVHQEVEKSVNLEDRLMVEYILNYPFKNNILIPHGYPVEGHHGRFIVSEELPKDKKADIWLKMEQRIPIAAEDFYNEFGVPHPDEAAIKLWTERKKLMQPGGAAPEPGK